MTNLTARLCCAILWSLLTAACQLQFTPTPSLTPVAETAASGSQQSGLTGVVTAASDVASQPDAPLANQTVVAISEDAAARLLGMPVSAADEQALRFLHASVPGDDKGIFTTQTDSEGRYTLLLEPGIYALCLADVAADGETLELRGCGRVEVTPDEMQTVNISSGFGEILLQ